MAYLLTQMFLYLLVAFLLGLLLGWLIWRYSDNANSGEMDALKAENDRLKADLDACGQRSAALQAEADGLRGEVASLQSEANAAAAAAAAMPAAVAAEPAETVAVEESKPEGLSGPRGGVADDLQRINGVGPKMEGLLHSLGYYHFDQIANWTTSEVAWVDNNLEGFKGRVTRDSWQDQAKVLAAE